MKIAEIKAFSAEELNAELERLERHLFDIRSQAVTEKLEDPSLLGKAKQDIARIKTVMAQRRQQEL